MENSQPQTATRFRIFHEYSMQQQIMHFHRKDGFILISIRVRWCGNTRGVAQRKSFGDFDARITTWLQTNQHKRAGLVVVTIELEKALSQTMSNMQPTKTWSPYRDPLAKFLNRYAAMVPSLLPPSRVLLLVSRRNAGMCALRRPTFAVLR